LNVASSNIDRRRTRAGLLLIAGGLGLASYYGYDSFVMGRLINTGYPDKTGFDYASFAFPLFLAGGLAAWPRPRRSAEGERAAADGAGGRNAVRIAAAALIVVAAAMFFAEWIYHASIPVFVLLFYPGSLAASAALLTLLRLPAPAVQRACLGAAALLTALFPIAPQLIVSSHGLYAATDAKGLLGVGLGLAWTAFGIGVLRFPRKERRRTSRG